MCSRSSWSTRTVATCRRGSPAPTSTCTSRAACPGSTPCPETRTTDRRYRLGILRERAGRGGSAYVHDTLRPGETVDFAGPRNHFRLEPAAAYVFVAGGIGITPILPMLAAATAAGAEWTLLYGGRTAASMAFTDELARVRRPGHPLAAGHAWAAGPRRAARHRPGRTRSSTAAARSRCSRAVEQRMSAWPAAALHLERFSAPVVERDPADEHALEVVLAESGRTVSGPAGPVDPRGAARRGRRRAERLPRGHLRHLRGQGDRGRGRPPRPRAQRAGAGRQQLHDGLRLAGLREASGARDSDVRVPACGTATSRGEGRSRPYERCADHRRHGAHGTDPGRAVHRSGPGRGDGPLREDAWASCPTASSRCSGCRPSPRPSSGSTARSSRPTARSTSG